MRVSGICVIWGMLLAPGCRHAHSEPTQEKAPEGQVWLTTEQVLHGKIESQLISPREVDDTVLTSGKIAFDDAKVAHAFSPVAGRVTKIAVTLGQRVKKGDVLALIESPEIGAVSADLNKASAEIIAAEHDLGRQKELLASHAASQRDFEQSEDAYRKAKAELERARQKARLLRTGGYDAVSQTFSLRSEIDGEVVSRNVSPGMEVQGQYAGGTSTELFTVGELDRVWMVADVFEMDLARVHVGTTVVAKVLAFPAKSFEGKVEWVSGVLEASTHTAKVRCSFDNKNRELKPEMYASVSISVDQRKALAVPRSAVLRLGEQTVVFLDRGTAGSKRVFERRLIKVDEAEGSPWLVVEHGLEDGANVVTNGGILLSGER
jgi:membrane fusion protein, heavy metal efflux system